MVRFQSFSEQAFLLGESCSEEAFFFGSLAQSRRFLLAGGVPADIDPPQRVRVKTRATYDEGGSFRIKYPRDLIEAPSIKYRGSSIDNKACVV